MDDTNKSTHLKPVTLAERFDEIREVFRQEKAELRVPRRRDRRNDFVRVLDEAADWKPA